MAKPVRNMGASVRARLLALAKERRQPLDLLLTRFALERVLYRLSLTDYRRRFALKGAMLTATWFADPLRPTRDADLLGFGPNDAQTVLDVFREICSVELDDGLAINRDGLRIDPIRDETEYGGLRLRTTATVAGARVRIVIDIGFGDAIEPGLEEIALPVLLDLPMPQLRAYARETVIAEKLQAMVMLGRANSRIKDYYDIWMLAQTHAFDGDRLARAIAATFARRRTPLPDTVPEGLSEAFAADPMKRRQWEAFAAELAVKPNSLDCIVAELAAFLMAHVIRARAAAPEGPE